MWRPRTMRFPLGNVSCLTVLLAMASCSTIRFRVPPVCVATPEAEVFAPSIEDANRLAALVVEVAPRVRALLGRDSIKRAKIALVDPSVALGAKGLSWESWIFVTRGHSDYERTILAHELVHWYFDGVWTQLTGVMEEGVADWIAGSLDPVNLDVIAKSRFKSLRKVVQPNPILALQISRSEWLGAHSIDPDSTLSSIGFVITMRLGLDRVRELCKRSRALGYDAVPAQWLLDAAELPASDVRQWDLWPRSVEFTRAR